MSIFNLTDEKMKETSSTFTAHEIYQQPATWRKTCAQLAACKDELRLLSIRSSSRMISTSSSPVPAPASSSATPCSRP